MIGQYVTMFGDVISHVNISAVKSEDGGDYECTATSRAGDSSHSARLNIYGKLLLFVIFVTKFYSNLYFCYFHFILGMPYVRPMPRISAVAGKSFFLKCPVAGYPIESIILEKGM